MLASERLIYLDGLRFSASNCNIFIGMRLKSEFVHMEAVINGSDLPRDLDETKNSKDDTHWTMWWKQNVGAYYCGWELSGLKWNENAYLWAELVERTCPNIWTNTKRAYSPFDLIHNAGKKAEKTLQLPHALCNHEVFFMVFCYGTDISIQCYLSSITMHYNMIWNVHLHIRFDRTMKNLIWNFIWRPSAWIS